MDQRVDLQLALVGPTLAQPTRKPCCRKETARCISCSFRFKVRRQHRYKFSSSRASKSMLQSSKQRHKTEFNAKWPFKVIQGHVFWSQWKGDRWLSQCASCEKRAGGGAHGERVGPGPEPLVGGHGGEAPLKLKAFWLVNVPQSRKIHPVFCFFCKLFIQKFERVHPERGR